MKKIQLAFKQAMCIIAKDLGLHEEDLNLWVKCSNGEVNLIARNDEKVIRSIRLQRLIGAKMLGLRMTTDRLSLFFQSVHAAYVKGEKLTNPDMVSLVLYSSKRTDEVCIGVYVNDKAQRAFRLAELLTITGIGSELLN